jgi:hypothetical protein
MTRDKGTYNSRGGGVSIRDVICDEVAHEEQFVCSDIVCYNCVGLGSIRVDILG